VAITGACVRTSANYNLNLLCIVLIFCIPCMLTVCKQYKVSQLTVHVSWETLYGLRTLWSRDGVVGIATRYGLEGPVIESRCRRDFPHLLRPAPRPTQPPVQWVLGLSRG
jgi:hypothetical protein